MTQNKDSDYTSPVPHLVIEENAVLTVPQAEAMLGLGPVALAEEVAYYRLRLSKFLGRELVIGSELMRWLGSKECGPPRLTGDRTIDDMNEEAGIFEYACEHLFEEAKREMMSGPCPGYVPIKLLARCLAEHHYDTPFSIAVWQVGEWFRDMGHAGVSPHNAIRRLVKDGVLDYLGLDNDRRAKMFSYNETEHPKEDEPPDPSVQPEPKKGGRRKKPPGHEAE
jgi:hypothetical protein